MVILLILLLIIILVKSRSTYWAPIEGFADPYSICLHADAQKRHERWQDIHTRPLADMRWYTPPRDKD